MEIKNCRVCNSDKLEEFLDLGLQPWCNNFVCKEEVGHELRYPLVLYFCHNCTTVQINYNVAKHKMYSDHLYLSGITSTMKNHFDSVTNRLIHSTRTTNGLVVDIGSNDGTLLTSFSQHGFRVLGIEPCQRIAGLANSYGIPTLNKYFDLECAKEIQEKHGKAVVVSAANVFYHVEDLHSIVAGVKSLLSHDGVFVMQGSYLPDIIKTRAFDILYHEHLLYYRYETLQELLDMYDLEVFHLYRAAVHGGSIVVYAGHKGEHVMDESVESFKREEYLNGYRNYETYARFGKSIKRLREQIKSLVTSVKSSGSTIYAYGAPAKGTVLLNYCQLTSADIGLAVEKNSFKIGRFIPGTGIEICDETKVNEPDYYLMLPWNFLQEFCQSEKFLSGDRKFIVPVPYPRILSR